MSEVDWPAVTETDIFCKRVGNLLVRRLQLRYQDKLTFSTF